MTERGARSEPVVTQRRIRRRLIVRAKDQETRDARPDGENRERNPHPGARAGWAPSVRGTRDAPHRDGWFGVGLRPRRRRGRRRGRRPGRGWWWCRRWLLPRRRR